MNIESSKKNNLNAIKFICALLVILHHSYPISLGVKYIDPFMKNTNNNFSLGNFSVTVFLFIAGMLIAKSYMKTKNPKKFLWKRIKRLLPSLIIVILFTVFIIGPIFTNSSIKTYFLSISTYKYLISNCLLITNHNLLVFRNNIYNLSPNGALWTLPIEFLCYIMVIVLGMFKLLRKKPIKIITAAAVIAYFCQNMLYVTNLWPAIQAVLFFIVGIFVYFNFDKIKYRKRYFMLSIIIMIISLYFDVYKYINILIIPYIILYIAYGIKGNMKILNYLGNYSYEIYLLGFLIQQCVYSIYNHYKMNPYLNFIISVPIVLILAILINKLVAYIMKKIDTKKYSN